MRIYRRGKTWYVDYTYRGRRIRKSVGSSRKIAELTLKDIELKIEKGENLGIHELPRILFRDYAEEYLEYSKANKAPITHYAETRIMVRLMPIFGNQYLFSVTSKQVEDYKTWRLEHGKIKPNTLNREFELLRHMFRKALEWGYVNENPTKGVKELRESPGRTRFLTSDEIARLLSECAKHLRPIVVMALNTGMRRSELFRLRWSDVNLRTRTVTVRKSKNNETRDIPINEPLHQELIHLPRNGDSEFVFPGKGGKSYTSIWKSFNTARRRAGIRDLRFHDLRHTFASHLVMAGVNLRAVQQLMGHKNIQMTMRYSHLSKQHLQEAVGLLSMSLTGEMQRTMNIVEKGARERA